MDFTPEQLIAMIREDPTIPDHDKMMMISQLEQAAGSGMSIITPGRLYSIGLGALAGWLAGRLISGSSKGGIIGSVLGGGFGLMRSGSSNEEPPGFSLDHRGSGW